MAPTKRTTIAYPCSARLVPNDNCRSKTILNHAPLLAPLALLLVVLPVGNHAFSTRTAQPHVAFSSAHYRTNLRHLSPNWTRLIRSQKIRQCPSEISRLNLLNDEHDDDLRPVITVIEKREDFLNFLEEDDRLCVVKFYASWCKSCQKFGVKFRKLASDEGDIHHTIPSSFSAHNDVVKKGRVRFAEAEYTTNASLCKSLKIRKLPTVQMYVKGKGKVAELTCKPSQFQLVIDLMHRALDDYCAEGEGRHQNGIGEVSGEGGLESSDSVHESEAVEKLHREISSGISNFSNSTDKVGDRDSSESANISFDESMAAGANLAKDLMSVLQKGLSVEKTEDSSEKKDVWFPFKF